jgi:hypothetical protein
MGLRAAFAGLVLALAACAPVSEGITEQPLPPMAAEAAPEPEAVSEPTPEAPPETTPEAPPEAPPEALSQQDPAPEPEPFVIDIPAPQPAPLPPALARQQAECVATGGALAERRAGLFACTRPTRDNGRACRSGADCEGVCLARSMTCAPVTPLFGCHEVLDSRGARQTLCLD